MNTALILIILIPIIEIYLFIKIGSQIGAFNTISLIFVTAILGVWYARYEGFNTLKSGIRQIVKNELPVYEIISGATLAFAAFLLILPGFATDATGILLIIPLTRKIFLNKFVKKNKNGYDKKEKLVTVTAVRPPARFGAIKIKNSYVRIFREKNNLDEGWINGGFFVIEPKFIKYIKSDRTFLEREPFEIITKKKQLVAFKHKGFWQCMDTKRDKDLLDKIIKEKRYEI